MNQTKAVLRFWGRDELQVANHLVNLGIQIHQEREYGAYCIFSNQEYVGAIETAIRKYIQKHDYLVVTDIKYGKYAYHMTIADITLEYRGKKYKYTDQFGFGYEPESVEYMYNDGNYACDCNRSLFIQRHCDKSFPELDCSSSEIEMASLKIKRVHKDKYFK